MDEGDRMTTRNLSQRLKRLESRIMPAGVAVTINVLLISPVTKEVTSSFVVRAGVRTEKQERSPLVPVSGIAATRRQQP